MRRRGGLEHPAIALRRSTLAAGHLDHPGPMRGPPDDRSAVVVGVDAVLDVGDEQVRQLVDRDEVAPVRGPVEPIVMEPGRGDDVDAGPSRQLRQLPDAATRVAGHGIDRRPEAELDGGRDLGRHEVDVGVIEVGLKLCRPPAIDDQVLMGVGHPEVARVDIAEDRPDEGHGSGETDTTDQPPSTLSSCPVTARDSSDRR